MRIAVLFGGLSEERDVSVASGAQVVQALEGEPSEDPRGQRVGLERSLLQAEVVTQRAGGRDHGGPGLRPHYGPSYYAAFILDPDGINVEAVCHAEVDLRASDEQP